MNRTRRTGRASLAALLAMGLLCALAGSATGAESRPSLQGVVNVNTASLEELQLLPGVGEARATAIVSMRKRRGGFKSVTELADVKGIGDALLQKLRPHVTLSGKTTARRL